MSRGRRGAQPPAALAVLAVLALAAPVSACSSGPGAPQTATTARTASSRAPATPTSVQQLGQLIVTDVPSGLPRTPDDDLQPPAGPKNAAEVATYADDPAHERTVLARYGFRYGWERFWGRGSGPVTSVFVDQFADPAGARAFTADLAGNDAAHYRATRHERPPQLPNGCELLTADHADPAVGLDGPAAFAWCPAGVFSVSVTAVSGSVDAAVDEVAAVVRAQLARLPGR